MYENNSMCTDIWDSKPVAWKYIIAVSTENLARKA